MRLVVDPEMPTLPRSSEVRGDIMASGLKRYGYRLGRHFTVQPHSGVRLYGFTSRPRRLTGRPLAAAPFCEPRNSIDDSVEERRCV